MSNQARLLLKGGLAYAAILWLFCSSAVAGESPLLKAMEHELTRNVSSLALDDYDPPYFVSYTIKDRRSSYIRGRLGALTDDDESKRRSASVEVRVGNYTSDNTLDREGQSYDEMSLMQAEQSIPLDDNPDAVRHVLWLLTDQKYKEALTAYHRVKGASVYRKPNESNAFSKERSVQRVMPLEESDFDRSKWLEVVRVLSKELMKDGIVQDGAVEVTRSVEARYYVNSEGTRLQTQKSVVGFHVTGRTLAEDGAVLKYGQNFYATTGHDLPKFDILKETVVEVREHLGNLRTAAILAPYTGPAILRPRAAGVLFHEAIGHRLEGHRQDDPEEGRTFAGQIGEAVLPEFLSVIDDPTQDSFEGISLNGHYQFDDEGVPAQVASLVEEGVLRGYLMGRKPIEGVSRSNGHGRAEGVSKPVGRMGNLFITASDAVPFEELKEMLLKEVRKAKRPFGLIIGDVTGGSTNTMNFGYQAFKGGATQVYKVDAKSGEMELVRGVEIVGTPLSSINKVVAASTESGVFNGYCGAESGNVPVATIAPALLLREIEVQRTMRANQRGPLLPAPTLLEKGDKKP